MGTAYRPTIIDIAKKAGVSFKTVSRVLNHNPHVKEDLRDRVLEAAKALNYRPNLAARSLAGPRNYTIALLMGIRTSDMESQDEWYLPPFLSDLQFLATLGCQKSGYRLSIEIIDSSPGASPPALPPTMSAGDVDGVLVAPPLSDSIEIIKALEAAKIPYVLIAPGLDPDRAFSVATDEYGGAAAMTEHLLALGHRRIAFIKGPELHLAAIARMTAYCDVLTEFDDNLEPMIEQGDFNFGSGHRAARALLALENPPTAIFCANDDMAAGAIAAANELGIRVPGQLSIAGFDDSAAARITSPALTTIRQPLGAMATAAIRLLSSADGEARAEMQHVVLPYKLIQRASTSPPPVEGAR